MDAPIIDDGGAAAAAVSSTGSKKSAVDSDTLKKYFAQRWITFDKGSLINYNRRTERLKVKNTPENLRRMEALLRQLDALEQPMIMVELKMVELTNTNLNELGFEWAFSAGREKGNGWTLDTNDPTRHGTGDGMFRVLNNLKIFPNFGEKIFGADTKVDLSLSINAVAQNRQAEVLASPRILSENNPKSPAMIKMVENTYFITEWEQPDMESEGFNIKLEGDQPEWDDDVRPLGVTFTVKPSVNVDNYTITLNDIKPVFYTHVRDYDNYLTYGVYQTVNNQRVPIVERVFNMKMPEFSRREITTNITLYDGETVLIGVNGYGNISVLEHICPFVKGCHFGRAPVPTGAAFPHPLGCKTGADIVNTRINQTVHFFSRFFIGIGSSVNIREECCAVINGGADTLEISMNRSRCIVYGYNFIGIFAYYVFV